MTSSEPQISISVMIITYNEEKNIESCLKSLGFLPREIFIVDSGSNDGTLQLVKEYTDRIYHHQWECGSKQWNWALKNLPVSSEWILALDADQRLTSELREEIEQTLKSCPTSIKGFYIPRRQIFRGRWIRYGTYYPKYLLKLFRCGHAVSDENELMDCRFYVSDNTAKLRYDLIEENRKEWNMDFWLSKHMRFAELQAEEEFLRRRKGTGWRIKPSLSGTPDQQTLFLKNLWYRMPLYVRPFLYFFYRYFLRLGFLDGKEGLIFHFFQGFWYRMLVDIRLDELRKGEK